MSRSGVCYVVKATEKPMTVPPAIARLATLGEPSLAVDADCERALRELDRMLAGLAGELQVEYYGPAVGLGTGEPVYRLVVREHVSGAGQRAWGLKVCTALPHANWRADWSIHAVARLRKRAVVAVLPAFFEGYAAAIAQAGKDGTAAGIRVAQLAQLFRGR